MLDKPTFVKELKALGDRFNRTVSNDMVARYYQEIQHMTSSDFMEAVRVIYRNDTFWPSPARFLQAVGLDSETQAQQAWERILKLASTGSTSGSLTEPERDAIKAVGGLARLGRSDERDLPFKRKEFLLAYKQSADRQYAPALPQYEKAVLPAEIIDMVRK